MAASIVVGSVNLYNASKGALAEMQAGHFHNIKLAIERGGDGHTKWIFTTLREDDFCSRIGDAVADRFKMGLSLFGKSSYQVRFGEDVRPYYENASKFHNKLRKGVEKAALLGKGLSRMNAEGYKGCVQDQSYWCETISPSHVSKAVFPMLQRQFELRRQEDPSLDYESWLQTEDARSFLEAQEGTSEISAFQVEYLTPEQRAEHRVEFRREGENTVLFYQGKPLNTEEFETEAGTGRAIFVIGPDHELYVGSHKYFKFHHTSFFGGKPVIGAGELITDPNGKLIAVTDKSGHYKPSKMQMWDALRFLKDEKNVDLRDITLIRVPRHREFTGRYNADEFLTSPESCLVAPNEHDDYR
ncbi:MAG: hypothetical protein KF898_08870 [Parachlamydiales bacterium]|nr:hypothetical protein [Candidatus Acheromyda pituitae]